MNLKRLGSLFLGLAMFATVGMSAEENPQPTISAGKGGFLLTSSDGDFQFRVRGYVQADGRFFFDQNPSVIDIFVLRRVRPIFEGTVYKYFDFKIMPDFGGGVTVLQDAYLDAKFSPKFKIRFGKSKAPFGLERLQSATDLLFVERSLATNLVPNRDIGIYAFGDFGGDKVSYAAGIFKGVSPDDAFDLEDGKLGAWEIAFRYSRLDIDDAAFPIFADPTTSASQEKNWAAGLNWYLNKNVKFVFSYDNTTFEDADIQTEKLFQTRFQTAW